MKKLVLGAIAAALASSIGLASAATVVKKVTVHTTPSGNTIVKKKVAVRHPMHHRAVVIHHVTPRHVAVVHHPVHRKVVHKVVHSDGSTTKIVRHSNI